ncbi:MAG: hypothetical protein L3J96_00855 [Thermoplasmata archaeon]|nr:hypothetical protein [Thermoplasmata archaeon]
MPDTAGQGNSQWPVSPKATMWIFFGLGTLMIALIWGIYFAFGRQKIGFIVLVTLFGLLVCFLGIKFRRIGESETVGDSRDF